MAVITTGTLLRQVREARGLSQREVGARAGTSQAAICKLESAHANPRIQTLQRVVEAMGYTLQVVISPPQPQNGHLG
jgi:transcriptional regulator with XRE-family HTH domain